MNGPGWARDQAKRLLADLPDRWCHTAGVARRALAVAEVLALGADDDVLVDAAYLHDVGYAHRLRKNGFHPLDGAMHLRAVGRERVACLVAHHSGARWEAELLGLRHDLAAFSVEYSSVADALTYCDSVVVHALHRARPELERCVRAVEAALAHTGDAAGRRRWTG